MTEQATTSAEAPSRSGDPLDPATRTAMEASFEHDFSTVRVHTTGSTAELARRLGTRAFTLGSNIVFATGHYGPQTMSGRWILAHELAHVVQQSGGPAGTLDLQSNASHSPLEAEADLNATRVQIGRRAAVEHRGVAASIQCVGSGLAPTALRSDPDIEDQRLEAIKQVRSNCATIKAGAVAYSVPAEAISAAILWEALENPYHRSFGRLGPAKVHPSEFLEPSEAEKVETEKRVTPAATGTKERTARLQDPVWAIVYTAAIMRRHADNYMKTAGVDISKDVGVLCTLFQEGHSESKAADLARRRKTDPSAAPVPGADMGPWAMSNIAWIKSLCP